MCSPHSIREILLDDIILEEINRTLYFSRTLTKEFAGYIGKKTSVRVNKELGAKTAELNNARQRLAELKTLFKRLYEDNVLGRISDGQFRIHSEEYTDEQNEIEVRIPAFEKKISGLKENVMNVQRFFEAAKNIPVFRSLHQRYSVRLSRRSSFTRRRGSATMPLLSRSTSISDISAIYPELKKQIRHKQMLKTRRRVNSQRKQKQQKSN